MKNSKIVLILLMSTFSYSQVGINTNNPTNTLDINGDTRIRTIEEQTADPNFVLISDNSGVVKKIKAETLKGSDTVTEDSGSSVKKIQTISYDPTKTIVNGLFEFRINGTANTDIGNMPYQIRLIQNPQSNVVLTSATVTRWGGTGGDTTIAQNATFTFTSANWNTWQTLQTITGNLNGHHAMISVNLGNSIFSATSGPVFYSVLAQRVDGGLKSLLVTRY